MLLNQNVAFLRYHEVSMCFHAFCKPRMTQLWRPLGKIFLNILRHFFWGGVAKRIRWIYTLQKESDESDLPSRKSHLSPPRDSENPLTPWLFLWLPFFKNSSNYSNISFNSLIQLRLAKFSYLDKYNRESKSSFKKIRGLGGGAPQNILVL